MTAPNLFRIVSPSIPSPFSQPIIAMEGDSLLGVPNLVMSDLGCFQGDCLCCPEDGSGKPVVSIVWEDGRFIYSTSRAETSALRYTYGDYLIIESGDISGEINTVLDWAWTFSGYDAFYNYYYTIEATNACGTSVQDAYCNWLLCSGNMIIDCETGKIKVTTYFNFLDAQNSDPEIIETYYNLGSVPYVYIEKDNKCGPRCYVELTPECMFTKNSLVYEFNNFNDISWERTTDDDPYGGTIYYELEELTNLSVFNQTFILPLYIPTCDISRNSITYNSIPRIDAGAGIYRKSGTTSFRNLYTGVVTAYSSYVKTYNVEYYFNFLVPTMKITSYHFVYTNHITGVVDEESGTCTYLFSEPNCGASAIYATPQKYEDQSDDQYTLAYRPPWCGRVLVGRYTRYDGLISRGTHRAYFDNL